MCGLAGIEPETFEKPLGLPKGFPAERLKVAWGFLEHEHTGCTAKEGRAGKHSAV
jgi:hypothetical protein